MGIEEQIDRLIDAGDDILQALATLNERVAEIARRFSPTVAVIENEPPAKPKRWRYRAEHEIVQPGDWANSVRHALGSWPPASGWVDAESCIGMRVGEVIHQIRIACEVTDDANQCDQPADAGEKVAEEPVEEPEPEPWSPKVGDWVLVTRPDDWMEWDSPIWLTSMHGFNQKVFAVSEKDDIGCWSLEGGSGFAFHRDWLSPAEPPQPPEPEYREPVLPRDAGKRCEFSNDGKSWADSKLFAWMDTGDFPWSSTSVNHWRYARIRKDA